MCKYCEEKNGKINGKNIIETSITYTNHANNKLEYLPIRVNLRNTKWIFDKDYSSALCVEVLGEDYNRENITIGDFRNTINFCPMCGRKLNKDLES